MAATGGMQNTLGYQEIIKNSSRVKRLKKFKIETGVVKDAGDVVLPPRAGGYCYRDFSRPGGLASNRFIYWRTNGDQLELTEVSLDYTLTDNSVCFVFSGVQVLDDVTIHEAFGQTIVLVPTTGTLHRLVFPHPAKLVRMGTEAGGVSVFTDISIKSVIGPTGSHTLGSSTGGAPHVVHAASSVLSADGEAVFALATNTGSLLMVKLPPYGLQGISTEVEVRHSSMMQRLWAGLVPSAISRGGQQADVVTSLCMAPLNQDTTVFTTCRDHKLRVWSVKTQDCVMAANLLEYVPNRMDQQSTAATGDGHLVRLVMQGQELHLVVYLQFATSTQFVVLLPTVVDGRLCLTHACNIFGPEERVLDYSVATSHIWALCAGSNGESVVKYTSIMRDGSSHNGWENVHMTEQETGEIEVSGQMDCRQAYMDHIFTPGRFCAHAILKALQIYRRSTAPIQLPATVDVNMLKREVSSTVELEVHNAASDYEMDGEEFRQLQLSQWSRLLSLCSQYQQVSQKPLGLMTDNSSGLAVIIGKNTLSYLRHVDVLEHLCWTPPDFCLVDDFQDSYLLSQDETVCRDVIGLCDALKALHSALTLEDIYTFDKALELLEHPFRVAEKLVEEMNAEDSTVRTMEDICVRLQTLNDPLSALELLLELLNLTVDAEERHMDHGGDAGLRATLMRVLSGDEGMELVAKAATQLSSSRLRTCQSLLMLLSFMCEAGQQAKLSQEICDKLLARHIPRVCLLTRAYYCLHWACSTCSTHNSSNTIETNMRQLAALELNQGMTGGLSVLEAGHPLIEVFLDRSAKSALLNLVCQELMADTNVSWGHLVSVMATAAVKLIWPMYEHPLFLEFLLSQCQYTQLQDYLRLTRPWCENHTATQDFLLGQCFLHSQEPEKALDSFMEAASGLHLDHYLLTKVVCTDAADLHVRTLFFLKVIKLFEESNLPEQVVTLAKTAIELAEPKDPNIPTLWTKVFKHELDFGHYQEAYSAITSNPDHGRCRDCLRQLVVVLCEQNQLEMLVKFPYVDLQDEVLNIIESRARSVDLKTHNYYDLLYAFNVTKGNYRRAGCVMYEYGLRLGLEVPGLRGLQRQAKCYLAAMTALRLGDPNYAWVVKPTAKASDTTKRTSDGSERVKESGSKKFEVLELVDLEREYMLVHARLQLIQKEADPAHVTGPTAAPEETVALLVNAGMYSSAVNICKIFSLPLSLVFEGLTSRCVKLSQNLSNLDSLDSEYTAQAWGWIAENEPGLASAGRESSTTDQGWRLLQHYLNKHEDQGSKYHKLVASKLLSHGYILPQWLITSYKRINAAELLRLYINYDLLEEAAELAMEYIDAVSGAGYEYFGLKMYLHCKAPAVWLPYTSLDQLLNALSEAETDPVYSTLYEKVKSGINTYLELVERTSKNSTESARRTVASAT